MPFAGIKSRLNGHDIDQIRVEFIEMYQVERRTLKEIAEVFRARGLDANIQMWKNQARLWDIGKYNKQNDMTFAANKARSRKEVSGKPTVFLIKGRYRDERDIQRYLKRSRKTPNQSATSANTPEDTFYFTPPDTPILGDTTLTSGPQSCPLEGLSTAFRESNCDHDISYQEHSYLSNNFLKPNTAANSQHPIECTAMINRRNLQSTRLVLSPSLKLPDDMYNIQLAFVSGRDYCASRVLNSMNGDPEEFDRTSRTRVHMYDMLLSMCANYAIGNVFTAFMFRRKILGLLPEVLSQSDSLFFPRYLGYMLLLCYRSKSSPIIDMLSEVNGSASQILGHDSYISRIMECLLSPAAPLVDIIQEYLRLLRDSIRQQLTPEHSLWTEIVLDTLVPLTSMLNDHDKNLSLCQEGMTVVNNSGFPEYVKTQVQYRYLSVSINFHFRNRNLKMVQMQLDAIATYMQTPNLPMLLQNDPYAYINFLACRGELRRLTGAAGSLADLRKSLELSCHYFGVSSATSIDRALHLQRAERSSS